MVTFIQIHWHHWTLSAHCLPFS